MSQNDIFYREISEVHLFLPTLVQIAVEQVQSDRPTQQVAQYIQQVNSIVLVSKFSNLKSNFLNSYEYLKKSCLQIGSIARSCQV